MEGREHEKEEVEEMKTPGVGACSAAAANKDDDQKITIGGAAAFGGDDGAKAAVLEDIVEKRGEKNLTVAQTDESVGAMSTGGACAGASEKTEGSGETAAGDGCDAFFKQEDKSEFLVPDHKILSGAFQDNSKEIIAVGAAASGDVTKSVTDDIAENRGQITIGAVSVSVGLESPAEKEEGDKKAKEITIRGCFKSTERDPYVIEAADNLFTLSSGGASAEQTVQTVAAPPPPPAHPPFRKKLTKRDVGSTRKLHLQGKYIESHPLIPASIKESVVGGVKVNLYDMEEAKNYEITLKKLGNRSCSAQGEWGKLVQTRKLEQGNEILIEWDGQRQRFNFSVVNPQI